MRATSENMLAAYYMGIPVKRVVSLIWAISAAVAATAGVLLAPITFIHSNVGLALGLKAFPAAVLGAVRLDPRRGGRRVDHRCHRDTGRLLPASGLEGRCALHRAPGRAAGPAAGSVRAQHAQEGLSHAFHLQDRLRPGHPHPEARRLLVVLRHPARRIDRPALPGRQLPAEPGRLRVHLCDRGRRVDDPDGVHWPGIAGPRRLPRDRRLHGGLSAEARRAVHRLLSRRRDPHRHRRRHGRVPGAAIDAASTWSSPPSPSPSSSRKFWRAGSR